MCYSNMAGTSLNQVEVFMGKSHIIYIYIYTWLVVSTTISQLGLLLPIYGKIKNVPNHRQILYISLHALYMGDFPVPRLMTRRWLNEEHVKDERARPLPLNIDIPRRAQEWTNILKYTYTMYVIVCKYIKILMLQKAST